MGPNAFPDVTEFLPRCKQDSGPATLTCVHCKWGVDLLHSIVQQPAADRRSICLKRCANEGRLLTAAGIALAVACWGIYGPVLHEGQHHMGNSRLKPLICVGIAYFIVAIIVPVARAGVARRVER